MFSVECKVERIFSLASRTLSGLFPVQPVALRLLEFSGKELECCLCYLIEWGDMLPVKKALCLLNTRGCGPVITQYRDCNHKENPV